MTACEAGASHQDCFAVTLGLRGVLAICAVLALGVHAGVTVLFDLREHTYLVFLVVAQLIVVLGIAALLLPACIRRRRLGTAAVLLGYLVWYAWPAFVGTFSASSYAPYSLSYPDGQRVLPRAVLALDVALLVSLLITFLPLSGGFRDRRPREETTVTGRAKYLLMGAVVLVAFGILPYALYAGSVADLWHEILAGRSANKAWYYQNNLGSGFSAVLALTEASLIAGIILLLLVAYVLPTRLRVQKWLLVAVAAVLGVLYALDRGTRASLVLMFGPALILWLLERARRSRRSTRIVLPRLLLTAGAALVVLQGALAYRLRITEDPAAKQIWAQAATLGGSLDFFRETAFAISLVPRKTPVLLESNLLHFLVAPIPRSLWPEKPVPEVVRVFTLERWGRDIVLQEGNVFPGIIGQFYMSWWWLGTVIAGAILGFVGYGVDRASRAASSRADNVSIGVVVVWTLWILTLFRYLSPGLVYAPLLVSGVDYLARQQLRRSHVRASGRV